MPVVRLPPEYFRRIEDIEARRRVNTDETSFHAVVRELDRLAAKKSGGAYYATDPANCSQSEDITDELAALKAALHMR